MSKYKKILLLIPLLIILMLTTFNRDSKEIDYKLNIPDTLAIIHDKGASLISNNIEEEMDSMVDMDTELTNEEIQSKKGNAIINSDNSFDIDIEDDTDDRTRQEPNDTVERLADNSVSPNRGTAITDNRRAPSDLSKYLNPYVLDVIKTYDLEGNNYPYLLNNDFENYNGVTEDIYYKGDLILKAHPSGLKYSHCTGISFEIFFKAMQSRNKANGIDINDFNGMTKDELVDFMLTWYVAKGPKSESNLAVAIEKYGLGDRITDLEDVAPGDFIDLSRENNTGHAVIFIDWIRDGNRIIGLKYWSSQGSTKGISYKNEYFNIRDSNGEKYGNVISDSLNIARINPVSEYKR